MTADISTVLEKIRAIRAAVPAQRSALAAISGIDGSGKGHVTGQLAAWLQKAGHRVAAINVDGWLNLPSVRFSETDPAGHFYLNALRFDDLFARLIVPLRDNRTVRVEADFAEETATQFRRQVYEFCDIDIILLEGIYLLKAGLLPHYDLSIWIECSFATALKRALARAQEGLSADATVQAYQRIYFPAQEIHFQRDNPKAAADLVFLNDPDLL